MTRARTLADYVAGGTTAAEFDYMDGVTSNVQTQLDAKLPKAGGTMTGNIVMGDDTSIGIADDAERIEFDGAGDISVMGANFGVGTTTPGRAIEIYGADESSMGIRWTTAENHANARNWEIALNQANYGIFDIRRGTSTGATPSASVMAFDKDGNVGIGTTAPDHPLHALGGGNNELVARFNNTGDATPYGMVVGFPSASPDDTTRYFYKGTDSTTTRVTIYSNGDIYTSDSGNLSSDRRLKHSIVDATSKLDDILKLKVRNFEWNADYHPNQVGKKMIGFIADEVEEIFPGLITEQDIANQPKKITNEDGEDITPDHVPVMRKTIKQAFTPMIIKAIQELSAKVTALENA